MYSQAVSKFLNFCSIYSFNPLDINETLLLRFISYLSGLNLAPTTVRVYLSGIRAWLINQGLQPPSFYSQRIIWAIRAMERNAPCQTRVKPFSQAMFWLILPVLYPSYNNIAYFCAMLVGYFGCLRAAEYTVAPGSTQPLLPSHLRIVNSNPPHAVLRILSSKTSHHGFDVVFGCTNTPVCAVCWLRVMLSTRPLPPLAPLFALRDGTLISRSLLAQFMQGALRAAGVDPSGFSPHSLRAGAATDAAGLGYSESQIQALGRWRSNAYRVYIRPSQTQQASLASGLASATSRVHLP